MAEAIGLRESPPTLSVEFELFSALRGPRYTGDDIKGGIFWVATVVTGMSDDVCVFFFN